MNSVSKLTMLGRAFLAALMLALLITPPAYASPSPNDGFDPGANNSVNTLAVQADGKIVVGGWFTSLGGQTRNHIARLNPDGTLDMTFNPGAGDVVYALAVQPDGKILVGGDFTTLGGVERWNIGRLNSDGSLDPTFNPVANDAVLALALQSHGRIVVGGRFDMLDGETRAGIGRLNANGTLDTTFTSGTDSYVYALAVQADGKIVVGGNFTLLGGQMRNHIGRLNPNGSLDTTFNPGSNGTIVFALALQPDGKIVVGGDFSMLGEAARSNIGRLNPDGALDTTFNPGANNQIYTLTMQPDGKILVGGSFTLLGGAVRNRIGRLNASGALDTAFNPRAGNEVYALAVQPDGKVVVGGWFTTLCGQTRNYIGRLYLDGSLDAAVNLVANFAVYALAVQPDGKILVGGAFTTLGGVERSHIGRLNADGTLDTIFNPGANFSVTSLAVQPDGKILVGGGFTALGGVDRDRIGRLNADGTPDLAFNPGADNATRNGTVNALVVQPDGKILVGGDFDALGDGRRTNIGRLNTNGTLDTTFDPGADNAIGKGTVEALAVQPDGKILVGGDFTTLGGAERANIGRLNANGTLDTTFDPGATGNVFTGPIVFVLAVQPDGKILVGGAFTLLGGMVRNRIGRLNANGTPDITFNPGADNPDPDDKVNTLAVQLDGKIVVGGAFAVLGVFARHHIGRLFSDGTIDTTFNPGANFPVTSLMVEPDGKILVGGEFTLLGGVARVGIGRLSSDTAALQELSVNSSGTTVTWTRSGAGPEVWRVAFESSTDAVNYIPLGEGVRNAGGWQLTSLALPRVQNLFIRARGYYSTGVYNGSGSITESVRNVFLKGDTTTTILSDNPDPSVVGQAVVVHFSVTSDSGTPTGDVSVSDGADACTGSVAAGACTLSLTTLGARTLTATYAGDANFNSSSDTEPHRVVVRVFLPVVNRN